MINVSCKEHSWKPEYSTLFIRVSSTLSRDKNNSEVNLLPAFMVLIL